MNCTDNLDSESIWKNITIAIQENILITWRRANLKWYEWNFNWTVINFSMINAPFFADIFYNFNKRLKKLYHLTIKVTIFL